MKVIDLLNKWANGEKLPTKICYDGETHFLINNGSYDWYRNERDGDTSIFLNNIFIVNAFLNDEVEIIEEDKEIEKLDYCEKNTFSNMKETTYLSCEERRLLDSNFKTIKEKFDELIDEVNRLKNKEK